MLTQQQTFSTTATGAPCLSSFTAYFNVDGICPDEQLTVENMRTTLFDIL